MGSEFVQDPFWGNWATNLAKSLQAAPGVALNNTQTVEQIHALREKRFRDTEQWNTGVSAANAYPDAVPAATVPPSFRDVVVENQGPVNPKDPTTQPGETFLPPTTARESYIDPRLLAAAEARRRLAIKGGQATILKDPSQWAAQQAYGEVTSTGVPMDPRERARMQFQTTGRFPSSEETKTPNAQNFAIVDQNGNGTGQGFASLNGGRTAIDGTPIVLKPGERLMETGSAPLSAPNPLKDEASARERLAVLSRSIGPNGPTPEQAVQIQQLVDVAYKPKRVLEKVGDTMKERYIQENPIPPWVVDMMQPGAPPAAPASPFPPPPSPAPLVTPAPPVAGDPTVTPPVVPPAVPPAPGQAAARFDPNVTRDVAVHPGSAIELRKEYAALPEVKGYSDAAKTWNAAVSSAYTGNKANDLAIVYGFIKLLDSLTGVRDAEVKMVGQVGSWAEQVNTMVGQATGKGLDARTRVNIIETMQRHMHEVKSAAEEKEKFFTEAAIASGLAPKAVLAPLIPMAEFDRNKALAVRNETTSRAGRAGAVPAAAPATPAVPGDPAAAQAAKDALRARMHGAP